ncbi:MAG: DinB family protein [Pseudomonadota bacterium]
MISKLYLQQLARYNQWVNRKLFAACATLSDAQRKTDQGAFFKSIHGTLNHLLWGDQIWMHRLIGSPKPHAGTIPESVAQFDDFLALEQERERFDAVIVAWADQVEPAWFDGELTWYSGAAGRELTQKYWLLAVHMFNHQTHHRGQLSTLLMQNGVNPGDLDLLFLPSLWDGSVAV